MKHWGSRRKWQLGLLLIGFINLLGLQFVFRPEDFWTYFENHDTRIIAARIFDSGPRADWFWSEWPLQNGFFRPLPAFSFALDVHLFGMRLELFKIQTWLLAALCSFAVVWFAWEVTRRQRVALGCGGLFALWQSGVLDFLPLALPIQALGAGVLLYGVMARRPMLPTVLLATLLISLPYEILRPPGADMWNQTFAYRAMGWPPGRTSTILALFALGCLAAYVRWERERGLQWLLLSLVSLLLCFLSYEQAVVLGPCLIGTAIYLRLSGERPRWIVPAASLLLVFGYWWWHTRFLPMDTAYQTMHRQNPYDGLVAFMEWVFPALGELKVLEVFLDQRNLVLALLVGSVAGVVLHLAGKLGPLLVAGVRWQAPYYSFLASILAFAPLALARPLFHYWYFPAALRVVFAWMLLEAAVLLWRTVAVVPTSLDQQSTIS